MRGNEFIEDTLGVVVLMLALPIAFLLLFVVGLSLLFASPFVVVILVILILIWIKNKPQQRERPGRVKKVFKFPKPLAAVLLVIIKVLITLLILAAYLWFMLHIPMGWALIITFCIVGFATGKKLNS